MSLSEEVASASGPLSLSRVRYEGTISYMGGVVAVPEIWCWSWSQMLLFNSERLPFPIWYDRAPMSHHATARNYLVSRMYGDWLMMLDTDHWFEPDLAWRLLDRLYKNDLDMVSGLYRYKTPPYAPVAYCWGNPEKKQRKLLSVGQWGKETPLFQVDAVGSGCLVIRRRVFDRIREELKEEPFDTNAVYQGEDIAFFDRCRRLGILCWLDSRIQAQHLVWRGISDSDFDPDLIDSQSEERELLALMPS